MKRWRKVIVGVVVGLTVTLPALAQRRTVSGPTQPGEPAKLLYKQDFEEPNVVDNFQETATWADEPGGAFGSKGALKVLGTGGRVAERYLKWVNQDTTIAFMYYPHGAQSAYFQARADKAGKNLHAYFKTDVQDKWQFARIKADSLVGFGGGASSPGESFRNFMFHIETVDKQVEDPYLLVDNIVIFSGPDGTPPSAPPKNLTASWYAEGGAVSLNWDVAKDDVGIYEYEVHRSESPDFVPARETRLAVIHDNYYEDRGVQAGKTYYYRVVGRDLGGYTVVSDAVKYESAHAGGARGPSARPAVKDEF